MSLSRQNFKGISEEQELKFKSLGIAYSTPLDTFQILQNHERTAQKGIPNSMDSLHTV